MKILSRSNCLETSAVGYKSTSYCNNYEHDLCKTIITKYKKSVYKLLTHHTIVT